MIAIIDYMMSFPLRSGDPAGIVKAMPSGLTLHVSTKMLSPESHTTITLLA